MSQSESERIHLALYPIIECLVGDPADTRPAIDEVQNTLAHMLREEQRNLLNKLNDKLFFSTTQPDGQFIKDTIMAEIDAINEDEWERKRAALSTESKGKE